MTGGESNTVDESTPPSGCGKDWTCSAVVWNTSGSGKLDTRVCDSVSDRSRDGSRNHSHNKIVSLLLGLKVKKPPVVTSTIW